MIMTRERAVEPGATTLLVVDMQNYVADAKGSSFQGVENPENNSYQYFFERLKTVIPNIARLQEACRKASIEVMYCVIQSLTADGRDRGLDYKITGFHVPPGSWDAEVIAPLSPAEDEIVLSKTSSSVFNSTNIDYLLRALETRYLIITGICTDQCVESAVRDACDLGYLVTLPVDACGTYSPERQDASETAIRGYCRQVKTEDLVREIATLNASARDC